MKISDKEVLYRRAKERSLYLLERRPLTISMLKDKLRKNDYSEEIIERVVFFLKEYHYLDDEEYVRMYVRTYSAKKSKKQIIYDLIRKGIAKDMLNNYFEENDYSEEECCKKQLERYVRGKDIEDGAVRQKTFRYLYGKGFSSTLIQDLLDIMCKNI